MTSGSTSAPMTITALGDPRVAVYRDVRDADLRGRDHLFMAESELVVRRLLRTPERLHSLFLSPNKYERLREAIEESGLTAPIYLADVALMSEIAGFLIHRGALAAGFRPRPEELTLDCLMSGIGKRDAFTLIAAEGMTNVDNMGALFRNAAAFGVDGIILDGTCCDPLYRKAIRVSVGHTLSVPYVVGDDWSATLRELKQQWGATIIGAESCSGAQPLWEIPRSARSVIILGSEAHGLAPSTQQLCDAIVEIPMAPTVPSLNVAVASAVVLYELRRCGAGQTSSSI